MALPVKKLVLPAAKPGAPTLVRKPLAPLGKSLASAAKDLETTGAAPKGTAKKVQRAAQGEDAKPKTVTVRMPPNHMDMLDAVCTIGETDRSEALKRGLRLLHTAYTAESAVLIITDANGEKTTQRLVQAGVPC